MPKHPNMQKDIIATISENATVRMFEISSHRKALENSHHKSGKNTPLYTANLAEGKI